MTKKFRKSKSFQRAADAPNLPNTPFRFICYFVNQFRWWYVAMVLLEAIHATCGIMLPYAIGEIVRSVTRSPDNSKHIFDVVSQPLMLFTALSVGEVVFGRSAGLLQTILHPIHRQHIVRSLYAYLQHHSHRYLSSSFAGALAHRIGETSLGVTQTMQMLITEFLSVIVMYIVSAILLYRAYPPLAAFVGVWAVLFISISFWLATRCRIHSQKAAAARSETTGIIVDTVTNLISTRLFARLGFERRYLNEQLRRELKEVRKSNWYSERIRWFQFISAAILKIGILYYSLSLWSQGKIATADFVVATSLSLLIISEARNLSRRFLELFEHIGNIINGVSIIVQPHELIDRDKAIAHPIAQGKIEFRQVYFSYSAGKKVFENLSVAIQPGQRVGLVGFSGSGKSTFVNLILRLFDPQSGQILIDGFDIQDMKQDALHAQIGLIPQDPSLFHRTLIENIRYGRIDATDEEAIEAARKAYAHDFIVQIQENYHSLVGERGVKLSGGQRQRIAIARVILKDAPILILDEATSSLDSITEKAIQDTLDSAMNGKTVIVVAHRLSTIAHLDRILVFDQGRIVEDGTHSKLLALGGAYYRLWKMQAGGFLPVEANNNEEEFRSQKKEVRINLGT
ncbi:ABC transporter ATP-binding protein [Nostocaceae cyanobacterium CENA369]|uniref:ABC transporter ATP-binding protein n=1 Tax=Dendronalium phyllosphericum CENA369 TaxID=1725256 RepID=A0A8J7IAA7_9NOST|nr:ABC transporter ATP-binding protein [Dendronalium phyllosphericum]MBH8576683.1 ABC transporter ATP-binding protein [Dendronalium phyllosphericum CENA369]